MNFNDTKSWCAIMGKNMIVENRNATFKKVTKFGLASLTAGAISIYSLPAYAQVDEIVVSARKTTENLQDVPVSVSAFTGDFIQDSGAVELADVAALTPNFTMIMSIILGASLSRRSA